MRTVVVAVDVAADPLSCVVEGLVLVQPHLPFFEFSEPALDEGLRFGVALTAAAVADAKLPELCPEAASGEGAGQRHAAGGRSGKLVSPERRRRAASRLQGRFGISERKACRLTSQHRSSQRYRRVLLAEEAVLRERLRLLARRHPRYAYRRIHALLRREG